MNLLKRDYYDDGYETVVSYYKCNSRDELMDYIMENRHYINNIIIDSEEPINYQTYIITDLEATIIKTIDIRVVK